MQKPSKRIAFTIAYVSICFVVTVGALLLWADYRRDQALIEQAEGVIHGVALNRHLLELKRLPQTDAQVAALVDAAERFALDDDVDMNEWVMQRYLSALAKARKPIVFQGWRRAYARAQQAWAGRQQ